MAPCFETVSVFFLLLYCNYCEIDQQAERHVILQVKPDEPMINGYLWQTKAHCRTKWAHVNCVLRLRIPYIVSWSYCQVLFFSGWCFLLFGVDLGSTIFLYVLFTPGLERMFGRNVKLVHCKHIPKISMHSTAQKSSKRFVFSAWHFNGRVDGKRSYSIQVGKKPALKPVPESNTTRPINYSYCVP